MCRNYPMEPVQENYYRNGPTRLLSCLPTIPAGKIGGVSQFFRNIPHYSRLYQCNPRTSPSLTASLAIIAPTRSPFFNGRCIIGNDYVRMYVTLVDSSWVVVASVLTGVRDFKFSKIRELEHDTLCVYSV